MIHCTPFSWMLIDADGVVASNKELQLWVPGWRFSRRHKKAIHKPRQRLIMARAQGWACPIHQLIPVNLLLWGTEKEVCASGTTNYLFTLWIDPLFIFQPRKNTCCTRNARKLWDIAELGIKEVPIGVGLGWEEALLHSHVGSEGWSGSGVVGWGVVWWEVAWIYGCGRK